MSPNQTADYLAEALGLVDFVGQFGISKDKAKACLADPAGVAALERIAKEGNDEFQISGTPTFVINGQKVEGTSWETLEPQLKKAGA
jgi:protein-disulfide isomerase